MSPAVFIDANVAIYAAGGAHPYKEPCSRVLRMAAADPQQFVTDSEVLQELMHRYLASGRWALGTRAVIHAFAEVMDGRVEPCSGGGHTFGVAAGGPPRRRQRSRPGARSGDAAPRSQPHHLG